MGPVRLSLMVQCSKVRVPCEAKIPAPRAPVLGKRTFALLVPVSLPLIVQSVRVIVELVAEIAPPLPLRPVGPPSPVRLWERVHRSKSKVESLAKIPPPLPLPESSTPSPVRLLVMVQSMSMALTLWESKSPAPSPLPPSSVQPPVRVSLLRVTLVSAPSLITRRRLLPLAPASMVIPWDKLEASIVRLRVTSNCPRERKKVSPSSAWSKVMRLLRGA